VNAARAGNRVGAVSVEIDGDALVAFTQELVRIPSVFDPDRGLNEEPAAELVAAQMRAFGWDPIVEIVEPGRPTVICTIEGDAPGRTLLFEGHTDVVTEGDRSRWSVDPFGGELRDGKIWGRGSADMKAGVAAMLFATDAVVRSGSFPGTIKLAALVDEEGMMIGIKDYIKKGHADIVDACLVPEPEENNLCISMKGAIRAIVKVQGKMAHGAMPLSGINPNTRLARIILAFEEFEAAVMAQLGNEIRHIAIQGHITEALHRDLLPCPLGSSLMFDCIDKGADLLRGGARYKRGPGTLGIGVADGVNSLAAVKQLVYDEKRITMDELREALRADFEGYEEIRDLCLAAPKYGNDDDTVDQYVRRFAHFVVTEHDKYKTLTGGRMMPSWYPVSSNVPQGMTVAALPSGRKAGKPLADGVSPNQGTDKLGPTAVLRSVGKFQHEDIDGGTLLNVKFEPQVLAGDEGLQNLASYLRTFLDLPIYHIQFNVVDEQTLRCAQANPDEYRSMLIRVAGYSAFFVELHKAIQDDIISRTANVRV